MSYLSFNPRLTPETPDSAHANDVASVSSLTNGTQSGTAVFSGFTNASMKVETNSVKGAKRVDDNANLILFRSNYAAYDYEVDVTLDGGVVYLRFDGSNAIYFDRQTYELRQGVAIGTTDGDYTTGTFAQRPTLDLTTVAGYDSTNRSAVWTFGAVGFDVYAKYNGVEIYRCKEYRHFGKGVFAVMNRGSDGIGNSTIRYTPYTMLGSNRANKLIDLRDTGIKSDSVATTGAMTAGSNSLVCANAAGIAVGDRIIVEIGGEAGLGYRGTEGVGGAWPATSYTNATARDADTTKPVHTNAWLRSTGYAYEWNGSAWVDSPSTSQNHYYNEKALPFALRAKVTAKSGNTLTLDSNAVVTTTGAAVYVDAFDAMFPLADNGTYVQYLPTNVRVQIPAGRFALGAPIDTSGKPAWQVFGQGEANTEIFSPKGSPQVSLSFTNSDGVRVRSFAMTGNHKIGASGEIDGFQILYDANGAYTAWGWAVQLVNCSQSIVRNMAIKNIISGAVVIKNSTNVWSYNCTLNQNAGAQAYTQWYMTQVNCYGGGFADCTVTGPKLIKAFESFACAADAATGLGTQYLRCGGQNALFSSNSSQGLKLLEWSSTVTADAYGYLNAGYFGEAILNLSANAYHSPVDIYVRNPRIIQSGYVRSSDSTSMYAIQVSPDCNGVVIEGEYASATTPFSTSLGGYIEAPNYVGASGTSAGSVAVIDQGTNTTIRGLRAVGAVGGTTYQSIDNIGAATAGTITGNIADTFGFKTGTTKSGNRTNVGAAMPSTSLKLVTHGDSITSTAQPAADPTQYYGARLNSFIAARRSETYTLVRQGIGGHSFNYAWPSSGNPSTLIQDAVTNIDPHVGPDNILVAYAGTNGIWLGGHSAATEANDADTYIQARIAAGWTPANIYLVALLPRETMPGKTRNAFNRALAAVCATRGCNLVAIHEIYDLGNCSIGDTVFLADQIHPTIYSHELIAETIYDKIYNTSWTAAQIAAMSGTTLALDLDAQDATTLFSDAGVTQATSGQAVYQWNDKSGNARHVTQATLGNRPLLSTMFSKPAVLFDGVNDFLQNTALSGFPTTMVVAAAWAPGSGNQALMDSSTGSSSDGPAVSFQGQVSVNNLGSDTFCGPLSATSGKQQTLNVGHGGYTVSNGAASYGRLGTTASPAVNKFKVGQSYTSGLQMNGPIGRLLIFGGQIRSVDQRRLADLLNIQWSVDGYADLFSFTDLTGQAQSTVVSSSVLTVSGIGANNQVRFALALDSGSGGTIQGSINGGAWGSIDGTAGVFVSNGDTVQLRLTTPASAASQTVVIATIGKAQYLWSVTTA